ncbi:DUF5801 repeats-in-toxin domain-containing protein [Bradyrhizobium genosp. P]|uniref:DUF5801 repeats-in-toxin domain-containing protein n=1 Tax=Bradyrhizobium genosp. P TaxID=83641 RepID=UPI003CF39CCA
MVALGQLPQLIGNIQAVHGCGTVTRAGGLAVHALAGDPVCQDDVIETATDARIEIRFIDGSVLNLSGDRRVELSGLARDSIRTQRSALFAMIRRILAFVGGQPVKRGFLTDAPIGGIQGQAPAGSIGVLSLAALTLSLLKQAQAAEPDVTFLDDDSIPYKSLHHGVFELVTKDGIHFIVDDPEETIVLAKRGSSIGIDQITNTPAQMAQLREAQQDALATYEEGLGAKGSGTPFFDELYLQPINFPQPDPPPPQNSLPPLDGIVIPRIEILKAPPTPPTPPRLNLGVAPTEVDTAAFDSFKTTTGTFSASSTNGGTLTYGISGEIAGKTVLGGLTYDESTVGTFGTLYLNSTTSAYAFVPNNDAINALKTNATQGFTITVSDGSFLVGQTFNITILGTNDASIISGTTTGSVIADVGVTNASPGLLIATGLLTDTDVDDPPNTFTAVSSPTKSVGGYGTFTITTAGVWTYTLDEANISVQALNVGDVLTDTFTVTTIGGTPEVVTVTIHGPLIRTGTAPSLTLSETHLTATALDDNIAGSAPNAALTTTSGNFATAFSSVQGADGATIGYALAITGGNGTASGLVDSHTGLADLLVLNGNTIEGHVGSSSGTLAFTITLDPATGLVTFTEDRAVMQASATSPDTGEGVSLSAGLVSLVATITDSDGDFQSASIDLGSRLTITDDGPHITATGTAPSLTLSETHLTATALDDNIAGSAPNAALTTTSGNFATAFSSVQGADGATIRYALAITGGNGTASGLVDSHTGLADLLVLNGNTIEGHVGSSSGTLAFTITLDPATGLVTFTEDRAVMQASATSPDTGEGVSLSAGLVSLVATITDRDGDFQSASIDLGSRLTITDDGPTIGGFQETVIAAQDNQIANGTFQVNFGADGDAAMLIAINNGAVGSTGYDLATSSLDGGITSVHVTGNGDDYSFYYTTHAVSGGVELDAYFADTSGTLTDPYFTLLLNPDRTYSFDTESVEVLKEVTVAGSDFGASGGGTPSLIAPDGQLVITGSDNTGNLLDVKASNNGIAVGDTGLQMDPNEQLNLTFLEEQSQVSFVLTQWQGNGTADVIFKVLDGGADIHDFNINVPKPSGGAANIVVQETSNASLVDTYTFDSTTLTYTLYVGHTFGQVQVNYDHAAAGNTSFTVNNITYNESTTIPSTDLLFNVSAVDRDGDSAATGFQVDLQGSTTGAAAFTFAATLDSTTPIGGGGTGSTTTMSSPTIEAAGATSGTPIAAGTPTDPAVGNTYLTAFDQSPAWFDHHEHTAGAHVPPAISYGARAIEPPVRDHQPDGYFHIAPIYAPGALVAHVPHDLIL